MWLPVLPLPYLNYSLCLLTLGNFDSVIANLPGYFHLWTLEYWIEHVTILCQIVILN